MSQKGTQSPPLEATNEHIPMGISGVSDAHAAPKPMKDVDQRGEYFGQGESTGPNPASAGDDIASAAAQAEKSAQSVTNQHREQRKA
ncbi:hypothetical protein M422DRAFT_266066 [Sphaerobolus stellatus SS14]|uniref:Unplaced genomic scaffold SPHSTscaffold_156, whole genome shotgun sequence n=1 Tax=Sphaerobolus stellatus (strain SS14) TaxID=990650 RepID=A0A0C9USE6_SPHS4|nr:hypothetical protein M422DRAFT_266066 [Sphaerobolus stellatus SS14]